MRFIFNIPRTTTYYRWFGIFIALAIGCSLPSSAQVATILGTITDPSGAAVPNVTVTVRNTDTNQITRFTSNGAGQYVAPSLPVGHYNVQTQAPNFQPASAENIALMVGDRRRVDFQLKVGVSQQTVTVEAAPVAVQSDSGEQSFVINGEQVTQLATNGRSVYALQSLVPGASSIQQDFQIPTSTGGDANVSFNGLRQGHNLWLIDGGESADRGGAGGSIVMPSLDAISEFRTMTSNYSAEYGLSSAGTMSMVVRSGTKQLHAGAWYFGRNDVLDARNYFNPAVQSPSTVRFRATITPTFYSVMRISIRHSRSNLRGSGTVHRRPLTSRTTGARPIASL